MMNEIQLEQDKVTVVIPVYNEERFLRQTLESVVEQVDYVIIGDNASTDETEAICREFTEKYHHIQYTRHDSNIGNIRNLNYCFAQVKTEFFFSIGGHDLVAPNFVEVIKKRLQSSPPDVVGVMTTVRCIDNDGNTIETISPQEDALFKKFSQAVSGEDPFHRAYHCTKAFFLNVFFTMYRGSEALQHLQNFPFVYFTDAVVISNILLQGKIVYDGDTEFLWRDRHQLLQNPSPTQQYIEESTKRYFGYSSNSDWNPAFQLIMTSFNERNCDEYHTKKKYISLLKMQLSSLTGEKSGYFFYDFIVRWKNSFLRAKWKAFVIYIKTYLLPYWAQKNKYRYRKDHPNK